MASGLTSPARTLAGLLGIMALFLGLALAAWSHPEDEFCTPGGGMDPELCRALQALDRSEPAASNSLPDFTRSDLDNAIFYVEQGVGHILPGGLDHILFVLALVLAARRWGGLFLQITLFTLAHSITLALAGVGWVEVPGPLVELLIALSIAVMAFEPILFRNGLPGRSLIVFLFGLLHGLGFANFFLDLSLPPNLFWSSLIGFNVGVEIGQLSVALLAILVLFALRRFSWYRWVVVIPGSFVIGGIALWWAIERFPAIFNV